MKELPYLKFYTGEYLAGDITSCSLMAQGLFINICCYYWTKQGHYFLASAKQRFSNCEKEFKELINKEIIKTNENEIIITFLDEQLKERKALSLKRSKAGRYGGLAKAKQVSGKRVAKLSYIEEKRREEKRKEKETIYGRIEKFGTMVSEYIERNPKYLPVKKEFIKYWTEMNKSETKFRSEGEKYFSMGKRLGTFLGNFNKNKISENLIDDLFPVRSKK